MARDITRPDRAVRDPVGKGVSDNWIEETLHKSWRVRLKPSRILHEMQTEHQHLIIFDNDDFGRMLMLDGIVQLSTLDEFVYHEMMAHMALFALGENARDILIIGGGDGGVLREVLKHKSVRSATLCEIDQSVIDLSLMHFPKISDGAFDDPRAEILIADGTMLVADPPRKYDAILVDSTDPIGPAAVLFTKEFYGNCKNALKPGGVLVAQNGLPYAQPEEIKQTCGFFRALGFADSWGYLATTPSYFGGPMSFAWGALDGPLRATPLDVLTARFETADFATKYYMPDVHIGAFALPKYVRDLVSPPA